MTSQRQLVSTMTSTEVYTMTSLLYHDCLCNDLITTWVSLHNDFMTLCNALITAFSLNNVFKMRVYAMTLSLQLRPFYSFDCVIHHSADLECSTQLTSGKRPCHHAPHHIYADGINGSAALCWPLICEKVLWHVTLLKLWTSPQNDFNVTSTWLCNDFVTTVRLHNNDFSMTVYTMTSLLHLDNVMISTWLYTITSSLQLVRWSSHRFSQCS